MAVLEVWRSEQRDLVELQGDRFTVGRSDDNDYEIDDDKTVSRHHVLLECVAGVWFVHDLNTRNGTILNRRRIAGEKELRPHDELVLGKTKIIFREHPADASSTATPRLTRMELVIVRELVRPILSSSASSPAAVTEIASRTSTTVSNVKGHLGRIYPKFGIYDGEYRRTEKRVELARRVVNTGIVRPADVQPADVQPADVQPADMQPEEAQPEEAHEP
jgi:pSer/pThr/pTyr-binding forkhead associated (FHA) protein